MTARRVVYVGAPGRAHKMLPLLEGTDLVVLKSWRDLFSLRGGVGTLVLIDSFGRFGIYGIAASMILRSPLVIRLRGNTIRAEYERARARSGTFSRLSYRASTLLKKLCFRRALMVICNSQHLAQEMKPDVDAKAVAVVYNPYTVPKAKRKDGEVAKLPEGRLRLLTVTNLNLASKAQPIIDAVGEWISPELWEELDLQWVVCGTGYHEERLRELIRERGLEDRVHAVGWVSDVPSMYEWCDVLVHLTRMDAFPNVPMEAMMQGKPVITNADSEGTREQVFDGLNGFVVEDARTFTEALRAYAREPELRRRHAEAGRALVEERFSVETQRREMMKALEEAALRGRKGARS